MFFRIKELTGRLYANGNDLVGRGNGGRRETQFGMMVLGR